MLKGMTHHSNAKKNAVTMVPFLKLRDAFLRSKRNRMLTKKVRPWVAAALGVSGPVMIPPSAMEPDPAIFQGADADVDVGFDDFDERDVFGSMDMDGNFSQEPEVGAATAVLPQDSISETDVFGAMDLDGNVSQEPEEELEVRAATAVRPQESSEEIYIFDAMELDGNVSQEPEVGAATAARPQDSIPSAGVATATQALFDNSFPFGFLFFWAKLQFFSAGFA